MGTIFFVFLDFLRYFFSRYENKLKAQTYGIVEMVIQMCVLYGILFSTGIRHGVSTRSVKNLQKMQESAGNGRWTPIHRANLDIVSGQKWPCTVGARWCQGPNEIRQG